MTGRLLIAEFFDESALCEGVKEAAARGAVVFDVCAPYPIPDLQDQVVARSSRLPWLCFGLGVVGAVLKVWFEFWTTAVDWPLNVGGKPWNSLFAFIPVTFEVMVLFAAVSTVAAFLIRQRLFPGRSADRGVPTAVRGTFLLALELNDELHDTDSLLKALEEVGAFELREEVRQ